MRITTSKCYSILIRLLPFSLLSYSSIQLFNLSLIALVFADFLLLWLYNTSYKSIFIVRSNLLPFIGSSIALVLYLILHTLTLPVYTLAATIGILLRALSIIFFTLRERSLSSVSYTNSYRFGLVSSCLLSIFNDRLNLFSFTINANSLSITIVVFYFMYAINLNRDSTGNNKLSLKYIPLALFGLGVCASRGALIALLVPTVLLGFGLLVKTINSGSIRKKSISLIFNSLLILGLFIGSFSFWYLRGGEYAVNRINTLLTLQAQKGTGDTKRLVLLENATDIINTAPLLGHGSGYTKSISFTNDPADIFRSIHNTYLTIAVDYGLVGLIIFLAFIITYLNVSIRVDSAKRTIIITFVFLSAIINDIIASSAVLLLFLYLSPLKSE